MNCDKIEPFQAVFHHFVPVLHNPFSGTAADGQSAHSSFKGGESGADFSTLGNATPNDTGVAQILRALDIDNTVEHRRLRCLGHIINLAAKSFFFGANSVEKEIDRAQLEEQVERSKRGPVGKLHNVVNYIRDSPQRGEEFKDIVRGELQRQKDRLAETR